MEGVVSLQLFSPILDAAFDHSKLSNASAERFDPAVTLKILILKSLYTLLIDHIELQQKVHTCSIYAGDGDAAFRSTPHSLLYNKNGNGFLNICLSMLSACSKTEF